MTPQQFAEAVEAGDPLLAGISYEEYLGIDEDADWPEWAGVSPEVEREGHYRFAVEEFWASLTPGQQFDYMERAMIEMVGVSRG